MACCEEDDVHNVNNNSEGSNDSDEKDKEDDASMTIDTAKENQKNMSCYIFGVPGKSTRCTLLVNGVRSASTISTIQRNVKVFNG